MSGGASVPLTAAAIYFRSAPLRVLFVLLAASCLLFACYEVWRDSVVELRANIAQQNSEIERLQHRDYDKEHQRLAEQKLAQLQDYSLDLIHFLLHHGKTEAED